MKYFSAFILALAAVTVTSAQTPRQLKSWLEPRDGWAVTDNVEVYDPENLFDRINGAAPLYLENNFRELTVLEYAKGTDYITVEAYRHATPQDAFGMYASERSTSLPFLDFGAEAQGDGRNVFFFAGNIYVRMWITSRTDYPYLLNAVAAQLAKAIDPNAAYPPVARVFPGSNKIPHSESYTTANYIGHDFLKSVYTARYQDGDLSFQAFVLDAGTSAGVREILAKYCEFTKQTPPAGPGNFVIKDRYNGDIPIVWNSRYIAGIFSQEGMQIPYAEEFLGMVSDALTEMEE